MPRRQKAATEPPGGGGVHPRVVVLGPGPSSRVEMVALPDDADVGSVFDHAGVRWRITSFRTHGRVVFAEPR